MAAALLIAASITLEHPIVIELSLSPTPLVGPKIKEVEFFFSSLRRKRLYMKGFFLGAGGAKVFFKRVFATRTLRI